MSTKRRNKEQTTSPPPEVESEPITLLKNAIAELVIPKSEGDILQASSLKETVEFSVTNLNFKLTKEMN